ncbi:unnamed protein product [Diatraea saccharalis]|uniref:Integrin beta epidermal growth factor-like domain-containing protein n=1 Tax=Diatraea saccharalis TaxID=40085 RepID=A0A9N9W949_9NEOP|nr:unnamed protein product [Diatraea saccharalis]
MKFLLNVFISCLLVTLVTARTRNPFVLNENWVCNVKRSCLECLRLNQCSWCDTENKCFSRRVQNFEGYCKNNTIHYQNHGLSYADNAKCACAAGQLEENCLPEDDTSGLKCSGRGQCLCGRCVCDTEPDPSHPTKAVMGQYCEYDNFSCDGPRCNEGPYHFLGNASADLLIMPSEK